MPLHPLLRPALAAVVLPLLVACESARQWTPPILQPYRPDVQQGNVVTKEMADQLAVGMTRDQVRFLMGTPALVSVFHQDRWDYVYLLKRGKGAEVQSRRLTVFFKDNRLERFEADELPPEALADNLILGRKPKPQPKAPPSPADPLRSRDIDPKTGVEVITPTIPPVGF
ncbi:MAG: outer membrane protein assembly factor BamE [Burkholderiales bacterium]|jgi:outer membrane protein assembly factor BamE|nr:MAG: outer membrane protein assembly factor BamE [Burkholderiales bacterium]